MKTVRFYNRRFRKRSLFISALLLFALSFLTSWYFNSTLSVGYQQKKLQRYINEQEAEAQQVLTDTALMRRLVYRQETKEEFDWLASKKWGLFLFAETLTDQDLLFWNSQKIVHPPVTFDSSYGTDLEKLENGYYVTRKKMVVLPGMSNTKLSYVMIPVQNQYYVETENAPTSFVHDDYANGKIELTDRPTSFPVKSLDGNVLFYVKKAEKTTGPVSTDAVTLVFRLTALLLLLLALHLHAELLVRKQGAVTGLFFLAAGLVLFRLLLYLFPALVPLRQVPLFDPTIYGSEGLNNSLGALLINAVLLCWMVLFAWTNLGPLKTLPRFLKGKALVLAGIAAITLLLFITFQLAGVVNRLVVDSKISFEVTDYSQLSVYTVFSFFILALLSLSYYYFSRLLFRFILLAFPNLLHVYFIVAIIGLLFPTVITVIGNEGTYRDVLFYMPVLLWMTLFTLLLTQEQSIINRFRITIAGLLFWVFVFSVSLAMLIMQGNRLREKSDQFKVAQKIDVQTDPQKQYALFIQAAYLNNYFLRANFHRFSQPVEGKLLRDSITGTQLAEYDAAYNTNIYVFDGNGRPLNNPDDLSFDELNNVFLTHRRRNRNYLNQKDIAYYETSPTRFAYVIKKEATDSTSRVGTLFLIATPRLFQGREKFYPDLFGADDNVLDDQSLITAIYQKGQLIRYNGNYQFTDRLSAAAVPGNEFIVREKGAYNEYWYQPGYQKVVIVVQKKDTFIEGITLFSYLFCAFLLMVGIIRLAGFAVSLARQWPKIDLFSRLTIRSQIHATIIFISVLSFVIIGVATITYFVQRNKRENIETLHRTAGNTLDEIQKQAAEDGLALDSSIFTDSTAMASVKRMVSNIADVHGRIVNLYDTRGVLRITSDDKIYEKGVLSLKMDPVAFYNMQKMGEVQRVQDEYVSNFEYLSIYKAITDSSQRKFAYLNIPYFGSQQKLNQEISNFLVTIINLNAFIVLIAGLIALFITNRITRSFSVIGDKMKAITLGRANEEIEWNKNDEIGELVNQYNKMVQQLEESASALAKSEREGAWREMARQVAHEIKNPLTPMKLSIQYLQKAIQNNQPNVKELTTSVASTLIEQIDHLSKIAADFSQFANIGNKRPENIDLHNVISSLLALYATNPKVHVQWDPVPEEALMQADKTHMNRLFTNLMTNAIDACSERDRCTVTIIEKIVDSDLLISISDNGDGIPPEMHSKIFMPNFTTKTSGTGLGLAMCKGIVEQAGGDIWFDTKVGEGTTFFVQLPLVDS